MDMNDMRDPCNKQRVLLGISLNNFIVNLRRKQHKFMIKIYDKMLLWLVISDISVSLIFSEKPSWCRLRCWKSN